MAEYTKLKLTNAGLSIQTKVQTGATLTFSRIGIGSGVFDYPDGVHRNSSGVGLLSLGKIADMHHSILTLKDTTGFQVAYLFNGVPLRQVLLVMSPLFFQHLFRMVFFTINITPVLSGNGGVVGYNTVTNNGCNINGW